MSNCTDGRGVSGFYHKPKNKNGRAKTRHIHIYRKLKYHDIHERKTWGVRARPGRWGALSSCECIDIDCAHVRYNMEKERMTTRQRIRRAGTSSVLHGTQDGTRLFVAARDVRSYTGELMGTAWATSLSVWHELSRSEEKSGLRTRTNKPALTPAFLRYARFSLESCRRGYDRRTYTQTLFELDQQYV